jgi:hypothetical protein
MNKVDTISYQGKDYATVPARLKRFREEHPRASVETLPTVQENGSIVFKAKIVMDKADENSPEATGHSFGETGEHKAFEKLETVAVGRALALLGYMHDGQIATAEEMLEYEEYKEERWLEVVGEINAATKREEFQQILAGLNAEQKRLATPIINARIEELKHASNTTSRAA